jgi:hypothetical protein
MQNWSEKRDVVDKPGRATGKKRYTSPLLSDYGSVRKLTHGMGGSTADGMSGMQMTAMMP